MCLGSSASNQIPGFSGEFKKKKKNLPEEKIQKVTKECRHTINKRSVTARHLAHLIGPLSSTALAVSVLPRSSEVAPESSAEVLRELQSQDTCRRRGRSRSSVVDRTPVRIQRSPSCPTLDMVLTTDASKSGWGATDQECSTGRMWTQDERTAT